MTCMMTVFILGLNECDHSSGRQISSPLKLSLDLNFRLQLVGIWNIVTEGTAEPLRLFRYYALLTAKRRAYSAFDVNLI